MAATQAGFATNPHRDTWKLKVLAEADPGALARIVQPFQILNIVPVRLHAGRVGDAYLEVSVEVLRADASEDAFALIVAKLGQLPIAIAAVACS